jgi:hypothetical protein
MSTQNVQRMDICLKNANALTRLEKNEMGY